MKLPANIIAEYMDDLVAASCDPALIRQAKLKARVLTQASSKSWGYETRREVEAELERIAKEEL